jgi:hypothetical protein
MLPCLHLSSQVSFFSIEAISHKQSHLVGIVAFHVNIIVLIFYFEGRDQWIHTFVVAIKPLGENVFIMIPKKKEENIFLSSQF